MKRLLTFFLVLILILSMSFPVFASGSERASSGGIWGWVNGKVSNIYQAFKNMFVPREDYFRNKFSDISDLINDRFGGLAQIYNALDDFFHRLANPKTATIAINFPANWHGNRMPAFSFDVLSISRPFISIFRSVISGVICIVTFISCFHKLRTFFTEKE